MHKEVKNKKMYAVFVAIVVAVVALFFVFMSIFNTYDKNEYEALASSVLYDDDFNYIKVVDRATLKQKLDGNYYLYEEKDNKDYKYKIGKTAIIYNNSDSYLHLYGKAYQIEKTGDVITLTGETRIAKTSPTKFFKLSDRKYLMVDSNIKSLDDDVIDTKGYLIIELDKQGNATFANNELNFKALKPVILMGNTFNFDIANEKLIYNDEVIDLKNVIGSTNEYNKYANNNQDKKDEEEKKDEEVTQYYPSGTDSTDNSYYDSYLDKVINSVNNLTGSVTRVGENARTQVNTNNVYYDFNKWIALKSASTSVSTVTLNYSIFDPNSEYEVVYAKVKDIYGNESTIFVNKNDTEYTIRNLTPDSQYDIAFGYRTKDGTEETVDEITVRTKKANYNITVDKIVKRSNQYAITFTLDVDSNYVLQSGEVKFISDGVEKSSVGVNKADIINNKFTYTFKLNNNDGLGTLNMIKLTNVRVCDGETNSCVNNVDLNVEATFNGE